MSDPIRHKIQLPPGLPPGFGACSQCRRLVAVETWAANEPCPFPEFADDDLLIPTPYGPTSAEALEEWRVMTCPVCGLEHAHPPSVEAFYWPMCWECWWASQEEKT